MDETEGSKKVFRSCILWGDTDQELFPDFGEVEDFGDPAVDQLV